MELYLDIFALENTLLNLLVIFISTKLLGFKISFLRKLSGALAGTAFATIIVLLERTLLESIPIKILISSILVLIIYYPLNPVDYIKAFIIFCFSAIIVAGTMFFILNTFDGSIFIIDGMCVVNSAIKPWVIALTILSCLGFVKILYKIKRNLEIKTRLLVPLSISIDDKKTNMSALIDTGNLLCDPLTELPVIVAEYIALKEILPLEIAVILDSTKPFDIVKLNKTLYDSSWFRRLRVIPFSCIGSESGLLIGFKPDMVEIGHDKKKATEVIVGICKRSLSRNKEFQALLGPQLI